MAELRLGILPFRKDLPSGCDTVHGRGHAGVNRHLDEDFDHFLLGHADIQMTARYAQHAPGDSGRRAVAMLDESISSESAPAIAGRT